MIIIVRKPRRKGKRFRHEVTSRVSDRSGQVWWWELGTMVVKLFCRVGNDDDDDDNSGNLAMIMVLLNDFRKM